MNKKEWLKQWKREMIDSGYYFVLNVDYIEKHLTEKEMSDLTPKESVWIYIGLAKEKWNVDKSGG